MKLSIQEIADLKEGRKSLIQIQKDGNYPKYLYRQITEGIEEWRNTIIGYESYMNNDDYEFEIRKSKLG